MSYAQLDARIELRQVGRHQLVVSITAFQRPNIALIRHSSWDNVKDVSSLPLKDAEQMWPSRKVSITVVTSRIGLVVEQHPGCRSITLWWFHLICIGSYVPTSFRPLLLLTRSQGPNVWPPSSIE